MDINPDYNMKQIVTTGNGGIENLELREQPDLVPAADEYIIEVKAAGLNFADILSRQGIYQDAPPKPCVMGYEVSGIIKTAGKKADPSRTGEEVIGFTRFGGQSEQVAVKEERLFSKPQALSFEQAAALPVNYMTAWALLVVMGGLKEGESVLLHNAGGGVGLAAVDVARHIGATIYGTASPRKHEFLRERGVHYAIDYRNKDWLPELMRLTDGRGVELAIDAIGGKHWKKSYKALRHTGRLGMFGVSTASSASGWVAKLKLLRTALQMPWFHPISLLDHNRGVFGLNLGHLWHEGAKARQWMKVVLEGVEQGWVRPHVDSVFTFKEAGEAHRYMEDRKNIGKVILVP